jgi:hypothetical protein
MFDAEGGAPAGPQQNPERRFRQKRRGVAVGPITPQDESVLATLEATIRGPFDRSSWQVETYPQWPCLTIEVPDYTQERFLTKAADFLHDGARVHVSSVDIPNFTQNATSIWNALPSVVSGTVLNFSNASEKFGVSFHSVPVVETALFMAFLFCSGESIQLETIDFSYSGLKSLAGIKFSMGCFPELKSLIVVGNDLNAKDLKDAPRDLPNVSIVCESIEPGTFSIPSDAIPPNTITMVGPEPVFGLPFPEMAFDGPRFECPCFVRPPRRFALDDFPVLQLADDAPPVIRYMSDVFALMWDGFAHCPGIYADVCFFSVTIDSEVFDPLLQQFAQYSTNLVTMEDSRVWGRDGICAAWAQLFPGGLRARPLEIEGTEVMPHMFAVVVHGVVVVDAEGAVVGFDRTMALGENYGVFAIVNDHLSLRVATPPE